jgi:hypothetical protein
VREKSPKEAKHALKMMQLLLRIRRVGQECFPDARALHRPGFDDWARGIEPDVATGLNNKSKRVWLKNLCRASRSGYA